MTLKNKAARKRIGWAKYKFKQESSHVINSSHHHLACFDDMGTYPHPLLDALLFLRHHGILNHSVQPNHISQTSQTKIKMRRFNMSESMRGVKY